MSMRITIVNPCRSEDGLSIMTVAGSPYTVSNEFGAYRVGQGFAKDTDGVLVVAPNTGGGLSPEVAAKVPALVSGAGNRALAPWYAGGYVGKSVGWVGDSTTYQMDGATVVYAAGGWRNGLSPILTAAGVTMKNYGSNGESLASAASRFASLAANAHDAWVPCWGINDCRTDTSIIGSYGNAGQIAKALALQALFVQFAAACRAVKPTCVFIWRMPNAHVTGASLITGGVSAQNCMDVYRPTFRGDAALGVPSLASLVTNSVMYDTLSLWFNDTAYPAAPPNGRMNADGLHPSTNWYIEFFADLVQLLTGISAAASIGADAATAAANETCRFGLSIRPNKTLVPDSDEYVAIGQAGCNDSQADQFDANFDLGYFSTAALTDAWGAGGGAAYGSVKTPGLHVDDIVVWSPVGKAQIVMPIRRLPDANNGAYLRWYGGGPDGYYPTLSQLAVGDAGVVYRRRDFGSPDYRAWRIRQASPGASGSPAYAYAFSVVASAGGSLEIRGMPPFDKLTRSIVGKTVVAADRLILAGVTPVDGLLLTGLTWTAHGSDPGRGTIAVAGVDFRRYSIQQGVILSAT